MTGNTVRIGKGCFIGAGVLIEANTSAEVFIGTNVAIGPGTTILTSTHEIGDRGKRAGSPVARSVRIGDGAWIGAGVTILPGISIGNGAVVAAGSVIHKDVADSFVVGGQPTRTIRDLSSHS
ncbi:DapH/DapD/GlmU-related protein [Arthrobacter bambusae]|nr:acetyltransferase-like isoleucine patch superfamily enzyme [Arthrobacter bambusae]